MLAMGGSMNRDRPVPLRLLFILALFTLTWLFLPPALDARESNGTPAARKLFAEGEAAIKARKYVEAAAAFRKAIDADPDYVAAHQRFIESTKWQETTSSRTPEVPRLREQYERWAKQYPKRAVYRWALGFMSAEPARADAFFNDALAIDPAFARAHFLLARNADLRGDWDTQRQHLERAVASNPDDPQYLVRYANAFKTIDPTRFQQLASSVVEKFPDSPAAAEALYNLGDAAPESERRAYFDRLRAQYPADKFGYSSLAMYDLYDELTAPAEALSLAKDMARWFPANKTWALRVEHQDAMARAAKLVAEGRFTDARDVLENTKRPSGSHGATWVLLKAEAAAGAGQPDQAYATVVDHVAAAPDVRLEAAVAKYGAALKKAPQDVDADVWRVRDVNATPATPFQLPSTRDGRPVQLADYAGRVVLIAFWFPG
jgi:tetratricopeptide (TPR) repeat protein